MTPAIDSYCFHRYFGELYPGLESAAESRMTMAGFLDVACRLGARGVSLESCFVADTGAAAIDDLRARLDTLGLARVWAWGHPRGLHSGRDPAALEDLIQHIDIARRLGAGVMRICAGGRTTPPDSWAEHKAALVPLLVRAADSAGQAGVVLAVENHIDLLADQMLELLEAVASPHLGVCFDTANNLRLFEDPLEVARKLVPHTVATHVKDIVAHRGDPKTMGFWPSVPAGRGLIPLAEILAMLRKAGYSGLLALEVDYLHPDHGTETAALEQGLAFLDAQLARPAGPLA